MIIPQQKYRELVFQMLYSFDLGHPSDEDLCSLMMKELSVPRKIVNEGLDLVKKILVHLPEIDGLISETSEAYDLSRINSVERNVLRLGIYELYHDETLPPKVVIAEAIRLSKKFGSPEAVSYVNAIIDAIFKKKQGLPQ